MKTDKDGCSTCDNGQESYEEYYDPITRQNKVQYDYRTTEGKLFSTVAATLDDARIKRDKWLSNQHKG